MHKRDVMPKEAREFDRLYMQLEQNNLNASGPGQGTK